MEVKWDESGKRRFEAGVDRGVLYASDSVAVPWNGLVSMDESLSETKVDSYYFDGVKYLDRRTPSDFSASMTAYTYPDEFMPFDGISEMANGMYATHQDVTGRFGLSWRTLVGNDIESTDHAYKIHLAYNLTAQPDNKSYNTLSAETDPSDFGWTVTGIPIHVPGYRPTAHYILDTSTMHPDLIADLERILYGDALDDPRLPTPEELKDLIDGWVEETITITDHGDGRWSASGPDDLITLLDPTTFQIDEVDATYLDADTYDVSST